MSRGRALPAAALVATLACAALACSAEPPRFPHVVSAAPQGVVAPDAVRVEVSFSDPIAADGIVDGRWFALCRRDDLRDVVSQAERESGLGPGAPVVPARAALADGGRRAVLEPLAPLAPEAAFAAVLSKRARSAEGRPVLDAERKQRTIAVPFETGPAPDRSAPTPRWVLPPHGPVPRDVAALRIGFDEAVAGDAALLGPPGARAAAVAPDLLELRPAGPLAAGPLSVELSAVHDRGGNAAGPLPPLEVSRCASAGPPPLAGPVASTAGELGATVEATLAGMGRLVAEVSSWPGAPACGAAPAPPEVATFTGEVGACAGWDPCRPAAVTCPAAVQVRGLCPGVRVRARLAPEDLSGHRAAPGEWLELAALPPRPAPVITEVLADAEAPEAGGEYLEVANLGTGDADLAGYQLAKHGPSSTSRCALEAAASGPVPPGGHALVVGGAYDGRYALPPGTALYRCGKASLAGGLANDRPVALALEAPGGEVVSSAGVGEPAPRCPSGALGRVSPGGPDAAANWACGAPTPGACNAETPEADCPRRPW